MRHVIEFLLTLPRIAFAWSPTITVLWLIAFSTCVGAVAFTTGGDPVDPPAGHVTDYGEEEPACDRSDVAGAGARRPSEATL